MKFLKLTLIMFFCSFLSLLFFSIFFVLKIYFEPKNHISIEQLIYFTAEIGGIISLVWAIIFLIPEIIILLILCYLKIKITYFRCIVISFLFLFIPTIFLNLIECSSINELQHKFQLMIFYILLEFPFTILTGISFYNSCWKFILFFY
jgi:hypothetical protein